MKYRVVKVGSWFYPQRYIDGLWRDLQDLETLEYAPTMFINLSQAVAYVKRYKDYTKDKQEVVWEDDI